MLTLLGSSMVLLLWLLLHGYCVAHSSSLLLRLLLLLIDLTVKLLQELLLDCQIGIGRRTTSLLLLLLLLLMLLVLMLLLVLAYEGHQLGLLLEID